MSGREFDQFLQALPTLTSEQLHALRRGLDGQLAAPVASPTDNEELQRPLLAAGIVSETRPPVQESAAYHNRKAVPIQGESLSATVIRERRSDGR